MTQRAKKAATKEEIADLRARAARLGLRIDEPMDAYLPQTRCTKDERKAADQAAAAEGIRLTEFIRRRVTAP